MNSLPYYTPNEHLTFLGFEMQQNRFAPLAWNEVIQREQPKRIIELGTWKGGFTCILAMAAQHCGRVYTYDTDYGKQTPFIVAWFHYLGIWCQAHDVLSADGIENIRQMSVLTAGKVILLCDGGNKVKEFQTFAPFLKAGDTIAAHDYTDSRSLQFWNTQEIVPLDVEKTVQECGLERYEPQLMAEAGWLAYKKV